MVKCNDSRVYQCENFEYNQRRRIVREDIACISIQALLWTRVTKGPDALNGEGAALGISWRRPHEHR